MLNPKGMMIYVAILPQFIDHDGSAATQAAILSVVFILWFAIVYAAVSVAVGALGRRGGFSERRRRVVEAGAGGLVAVAAGFMALR